MRFTGDDSVIVLFFVYEFVQEICTILFAKGIK
jgi:hypothetical protein